MNRKKSALSRKGIAFALSATMVASALPVFASAADVVYPENIATSVLVKQNATKTSIQEDVLDKLKDDYSGVKGIVWDTLDITKGGVVSPQILLDNGTLIPGTITATLVSPGDVIFDNDIKDIPSTSIYNRNPSALLDYVNDDLDLIYDSDEVYESAFGDTPEIADAPKYTWDDCNEEFDISGNVSYEFTQTVDGEEMTKSFSVNHVAYSVDVRIDYTDNTVNTTSDMEWSKSKDSGWTGCAKNMSIPMKWYDEVVYFRIPGTSYATESNVDSLYIPGPADVPSSDLCLSSTSSSITIENCWDFDDCEFSLDGRSWRSTTKDTYTFSNLKDGTTYTVQVRAKADPGDYLASEVAYSRIATGEMIRTDVDVSLAPSGTAFGRHVAANAVVEPSVSSKTLYGDLSVADLDAFSDKYRYEDSRYGTVSASLDVKHSQEPDDYTAIDTTKFTMPIRAIKYPIEGTEMTLDYESPLGTVTLDAPALTYLERKAPSSTLAITMEAVDYVSGTTAMKWLKEQFNNDCPVYKLSVTCGSCTGADVSYFIPYESASTHVFMDATVYHVASNGTKTKVATSYNVMRGGIEFTTDENGYFVIVDDYSYNGTMPFVDVPTTFWGYKEIQECYERGLFLGTSDFTFSPNNTITKAEIVALLGRISGVQVQHYPERQFVDVVATDWYAPYAQWAFESGLVTGNHFDGTDPMQRQDIAKMLDVYLIQNYSGYHYYNADWATAYTDYSLIEHENLTAVAYMRQSGIMQGKGNNMFNPLGDVTRAEMATILTRLLDLLA